MLKASRIQGEGFVVSSVQTKLEPSCWILLTMHDDELGYEISANIFLTR
jgi:hypothetical protein